MNKVFSVILLLFILSCNGQNKNRVPIEDSNNTYTVNSDLKENQNKTFLEQQISKYVDSINNATNEQELPIFLGNSQFDYEKRGIWTTLHTPISVRSQIINRVNNCKALGLIIESKNKIFKANPHIEDDLAVPFIEFSFYDLALKRKNILECK